MSDIVVPDDLTAGILTGDDVARLATLGMRVASRQNETLPRVWLPGEPTLFLVSDYGTVAAVYRDRDGSVTIEPAMRHLLEAVYSEQFGYRAAQALSQAWTVETCLAVLERLALRFEEMKTPRVHFGNMWALHCVLHNPLIRAPRNLKHVARASKRLAEAGVSPRLFYGTLLVVKGSKMLERSVEASVFRLANPGVHPTLLGELFS